MSGGPQLNAPVDNRADRVCIVIPAWNEEAPLSVLLQGLPVRVLGREVSTIVVSDGSTDHTEEVAGAAGATVISISGNRGKGAAVRAGILAAEREGFDYLVTMDADGQHDPAELERLLRPIIDEGYDIVIGTRFLDNRGRGTVPLNRYLLREALLSYVNRGLRSSYTDLFCGYRGFSRPALARVQFVGNRYHCELETIFDAAIHGLRVAEVPVRRIYVEGGTKMGAQVGSVLGRIWVLFQYLETIRRKSRELRAAGSHPRGTRTTISPRPIDTTPTGAEE